jgi:hypothetical protein
LIGIDWLGHVPAVAALQRDPAFIDWQKGTETPDGVSRSDTKSVERQPWADGTLASQSPPHP